MTATTASPLAILDHLERTGYLQVGRRQHLLRPDLSNRTVCGRFSLDAMTDRQLSRPANPAVPVCGVCDDVANGTTHLQRYPRAP